MFRPVILVAAILALGASECETPPPGAPNAYCSGAPLEPPPSALDILLGELGIAWSTIVGGTPSVDRRSTVFVRAMGLGTCTGVILDPSTVITAAHCQGPGEHRIYLDPNDPAHYFTATRAIPHPDYTETNHGADLMILKFAETLPGPFPLGIYSSSRFSALCESLVAQGHGQTETDPEPCPDGLPRCLRESSYTVTNETDWLLRSRQRTPGGICFGDSGGPLYAQVRGQPGNHLAGITSWTASQDCRKSSGHVSLEYFRDWVIAGMAEPAVL